MLFFIGGDGRSLPRCEDIQGDIMSGKKESIDFLMLNEQNDDG